MMLAFLILVSLAMIFVVKDPEDEYWNELEERIRKDFEKT